MVLRFVLTVLVLTSFTTSSSRSNSWSLSTLLGVGEPAACAQARGAVKGLQKIKIIGADTSMSNLVKLIAAGNKLLGQWTKERESRAETCYRVLRSSQIANERILANAQEAEKLIERLIFLLAPSHEQNKVSDNVLIIAGNLFDMVLRSRLAGRMGEGRYFSIDSQLKTLDFFEKNPQLAALMVGLLPKLEASLQEWQEMGEQVNTEANRHYLRRKLRKAFFWILNKPKFTFPPNNFLAIICAITGSEGFSDYFKNLLAGLDVDRDFVAPANYESGQAYLVGDKTQLAVRKLVQVMEKSIETNPIVKKQNWLVKLRAWPDLFKAILNADAFITLERHKHKQTAYNVEPVKTLEKAARVPGEFFVRWMINDNIGKGTRLDQQSGFELAARAAKQITKLLCFSSSVKRNADKYDDNHTAVISAGAKAEPLDDEVRTVRSTPELIHGLLTAPSDALWFQLERVTEINRVRKKLKIDRAILPFKIAADLVYRIVAMSLGVR